MLGKACSLSVVNSVKEGFEVLKEDQARRIEDHQARERTKQMNKEKKEKGHKCALAQHKNKLYLGKETWWEVPEKYHSDLIEMGFNPDDYLIKRSDSPTYTKEERHMLKMINKKNQRKAKRDQRKGGDGKPAVVLPRYMGSGPFQLANGTDPLSHVDASTAGEFQLGDWDDFGGDPDSPPIHVHSGDEDEEEEAMTKEEEEYIKSVIGPEADWVDFFDDYVDCQMASC